MSSLFPELQDSGPQESGRDSGDPDHDRDRPIVKLALGPPHRAWRGASYSVARYCQLLGLPEAGAPGDGPTVTRAQVLLGDGRVELCIEGRELGKVTLWLVPCRPSRSNPTNFRVMLQGTVPSQAVRRLVEFTAARLHRVPYRVLLKVFRKDPEREEVTTVVQPVVDGTGSSTSADWALGVPTPPPRERAEPEGAQQPASEPIAEPPAEPAPEPERVVEPPAEPAPEPERVVESVGEPRHPEAPGPEPGPDGPPEPSRPSFDTEWDELFARSVVRTHAGPIAWRVFFAELEQQRNFNHRLTGSILVVRHEDLECCYATPPLDDGTYSFINYSSIHTPEVEATSHDDDGPSVPPDEQSWGEVATDMDDLDAIKGGAYLIEQALDAVANLDEHPDLLMVKTACVPVVIGDDLGAAMARFEDRTSVPTVYLDNLADQQSDFFSTILDRLRWESEFREPEQTKGRINLVGFPDTSAMNRLVAMLERAGVVINARLVPEIRLADMKRYTWAELQIFFDSKLYYPTFQQLFGNVDIPSLRTPPPYGVAGSRTWLADVAASVGRGGDVEEIWSAEWQHLAERWSELTAQARSHSLGFVVDRRTAPMLVEPRRGTGVPMLDVLQEMGFGLEFLFFDGDGATPDPRLPGPCATFRDPLTLRGLLQESKAAAYYSEYYFDRRLTRCKKAQFSIADFQLGLEGAIETLTRLLQVCSLPFYRRHGAHLGEPFRLAPDEERD